MLKPGGYLIVEIGSPQEGPARQRIEALGAFELAATIFDGSGHPRVLCARSSRERVSSQRSPMYSSVNVAWSR